MFSAITSRPGWEKELWEKIAGTGSDPRETARRKLNAKMFDRMRVWTPGGDVDSEWTLRPGMVLATPPGWGESPTYLDSLYGWSAESSIKYFYGDLQPYAGLDRSTLPRAQWQFTGFSDVGRYRFYDDYSPISSAGSALPKLEEY